jgi:hypothetical protein
MDYWKHHEADIHSLKFMPALEVIIYPLHTRGALSR